MIFGNKRYIRSPVNTQDYIWLAEFYDGTQLSEFDLNTKKPCNFYDIDKDRLIRFGLLGNGSQAYFDVGNGIFNINGHRIMMSYITDSQEYPLTGRTFLYNDIIAYKEANTDATLSPRNDVIRQFNSKITSFNVGYKKKMELEGVNINFYNVLTLPLDEPAYMQIKISADKDLKGKLVIRVNGLISEEIKAPLIANMTGIINWIIK